jgi:uncharacterized protein (TIGR02271 family)
MRFSSLSQETDFSFREDMPDVRGWEVRTRLDNEKVGKIDDIIFDDRHRPRYLDIDVGLFKKHVLLPIGLARVDELNDVIWVPNMTKEQLKDYPEYAHQLETITSEYETRIRAASPGGTASEHDYSAEQFYGPRVRTLQGPSGEERLTRAEEELTVDKRPVTAGEVTVQKRIETEHVRVPVTRRRQELEMERRAVAEPYEAEPEAELREEELRIPILEEELVVQKRVVVAEELIVRKRVVEETREIEADLRKERIEIDRRGNVESVGSERVVEG